MPRPIKEGIAFFYLDIGFWEDDKITDLVFDYGAIAELVYLHLVSIIYESGYFIESTKERMAKKILTTFNGNHDLTYQTVMGMIGKMGESGLLDKGMLDGGVFTSRGIQKQYYSSTIRRKEREREHWLLDDGDEARIDIRLNCRRKKGPSGVIADMNTAETGLSHAETPVNVDDNEHNKNKKENKNKNKTDKEDKYDRGLYPGRLNYFTSCLIEDGIISIYHKDIERFNELFDGAERAYGDFSLRQRVFRYVRDHVKNRKEPVDDLFDYFYAAFNGNLEKMEGYDERMRKWREECQAMLNGIRDGDKGQ